MRERQVAVDLYYMQDMSVKLGALLQSIEERWPGSYVRRTVEVDSGSCNQATEPAFDEGFLTVSKERPLRQNNPKCSTKNKIDIGRW